MTRLSQRLAFRLRLAKQRWRASAVRIVARDGTEIHWDRCDDFDTARAVARQRLGADDIGLVWQPAAGRRAVILGEPGQMPRARALARRAGWSALTTRFELGAVAARQPVERPAHVGRAA